MGRAFCIQYIHIYIENKLKKKNANMYINLKRKCVFQTNERN